MNEEKQKRKKEHRSIAEKKIQLHWLAYFPWESITVHTIPCSYWRRSAVRTKQWGYPDYIMTDISRQSDIWRMYPTTIKIKTELQQWCLRCELKMLFQTQCYNKKFITSSENRKDRGGSSPCILHRVLHVLTRGSEVTDTKSQRGESVRRLRLKPITAWTQTTDVIGWTDLNTATRERCILLRVIIIWGLHTGTVAD